MRIMKSPPKQKEESTTPVKTNLILSSKENSHLFNHIDNLAADHDVTVSQTMIKVTYKKPSKECYASLSAENGVNFCDESTVTHSTLSPVNKPVIQKKNQSAQGGLSKTDMYKSDFVLVPSNLKSPKMSKGSGKTTIFHSTPKQNSEGVDKKKEYINGVNLVVDLSKCHVKNTEANGHSPIKVHTTSSSAMNSTDKTTCQTNGSTKNLQKSVTDKKLNGSGKFHSNSIKFLKGVTLVKLDDSISSQSCALGKKPDSKKFNVKPKKDASDGGSVVKSDKKVEGAIKRKNKTEENTLPNKKVKKNEGNSQNLKKKLLNSQSKSVVRDKKIEISDKKVIKVKAKEKSEENSNSNVSKKKEIMLEDPTLPSGWKRFIHTRHKGSPNEKHIVYISSPQGKKFQFRWKLRRFLEKTKSPLKADQFYFGLYGRRKPYVPDTNEEEKGAISQIQDPLKSSPESKVSSSAVKSKFSNSLDSSKFENAVASGAGVKPPAKTMMLEGKQILLFDPDLPYGWRRIINSSSPNGKMQVHIISPDGRIFRRKYRLLEYLSKHQFTHSLDRFYFGLYPKKDQVNTSKSVENDKMTTGSITLEEKSSSDNDKSDIKNELNTSDSSSRASVNTTDDTDGEMFMLERDMSQLQQYGSPMYEDPNLPEGWKRFIKVRSCGESAGRMEVIIVSPDGKRHRCRGNLDSYLKQNNLNYKADDFDFSVFGKGRRRSLPQRSDSLKDVNSETRRKPKVASDRPVPDFDINSIKYIEPTKEGKMINTVNGIMISCGLSSARSERRLRLPRREHEKILKDHLNSEGDVSNDGCDIPTYWIQRLVKCRSDFRILETEAATTIAEKTKEFLKEISSRAFKSSQHPEEGLRYQDVADIVENSQCLSPLKELIPNKITYKEYVRLNRPKQFMSFT